MKGLTHTNPRDIHQPAADYCFVRFALNVGKWNACKDQQKKLLWTKTIFLNALFSPRDTVPRFFVLIYFRIKHFMWKSGVRKYFAIRRVLRTSPWLRLFTEISIFKQQQKKMHRRWRNVLHLLHGLNRGLSIDDVTATNLIILRICQHFI